ncbi:MAG: hypothetical protein IJV62_01720 [Eggerthellaceae bacterium]|nr:hypothetical protein [Eggerthellaceae bacterium]
MPRKRITSRSQQRSSAHSADDLFEGELPMEDEATSEPDISRTHVQKSRSKQVADVDKEQKLSEDEDIVFSRAHVNQRKRAKTRKKADVLFKKSYSDVPSESFAPRAALYSKKEGKHDKRARKAVEASQPLKKVTKTKTSPISSFLAQCVRFVTAHKPSRFVVGLIAVSMVVIIAMLYMPARQFYTQYRDNYRRVEVIAEYEKNNKEMQEKIASVSTKEGIEEIARRELGWVDAHEQLVIVEGREEEPVETTEEAQEILRQVIESQMPTPATWYSPLLDVVFGYDSRSPAQKQKDENPEQEIYNE